VDLPDPDRPDVLLVVIDCLQAAALERLLAERGDRMRAFACLARESVRFTRATTPSTWSAPAHWSLLSGRYPREGRSIAGGRGRLPVSWASLPSDLQRIGYRTACFSANPFLGPSTGLHAGFEQAWWGTWEGLYRRGTPTPWHAIETASHGGSPPQTNGESRLFARGRASDLLRRLPLLLDGANRFLRAVGEENGSCWNRVGPWIDSELTAWLARTEGRPRFALVNFMEAHEPYLVPPGFGAEAGWRSRLRNRQDFSAWVQGRWVPDEMQLRFLQRLYDEAILSVDHRLAHLRDSFRSRAGDRELAVLLTADHGQAFGEGGVLSHGVDVPDVVTRVPLWVRWPGQERARSSVANWASLVDVRPTLRALAGLAPDGAGSGRDLRELEQEARVGPVFSESEALRWDARRHGDLSESRRRIFDRPWVVSFEGNRKVVCDGRTGACRTASANAGEGSGAVSDTLVTGLVRATQSWWAGPSDGRTPADATALEAGLRSWGYC
jgi:arylsulfatase A-like enzyme